MDGQETQNPFSDEYNSGLFIGFSPKGYIGHTGGDPGVSSLMFFDPKTGTGRFLMVNTDIDDKPGNDAFYAILGCIGNNRQNPQIISGRITLAWFLYLYNPLTFKYIRK